MAGVGLFWYVDDFYSQCDPEKENLCLCGHPNESWEVNLPAEEDGREISVSETKTAAPSSLSQLRSIVKLLSSVDESKTVINSKDDEGWAPLHSAASIGNAELVEILLTRGADVNVKKQWWWHCSSLCC
ncbi:ankyrin repeat domain-containing protein 49 [Brassica rapa]|uniref:ankyrin repeat domain-containing protein 49 n=1 Tax=Brassica campestris TaxID=3711 RepID=UPI00142D6D45|nr:ankyrin repeat domain-containing protein 49 [Brassica rapa]